MTLTHRIPTIASFALLSITFLMSVAWIAPAEAADASEQEVTEMVPAAAPTAVTAVQSPVSRVFTNIGNGFKAVGRTVAGWFRALMRLLGFGQETSLPEMAACEEVADCGPNLVCLNTCVDETSCEVFEKRCIPISSEVTRSVPVKALYTACGANDLCAKGTDCRRTCPAGMHCEIMNRCLTSPESLDACEAASDCTAVCGRQLFPPIGPSAYLPVCRDGHCQCLTKEVRPELRIAPCTEDALKGPLVCPAGTRAACTAEGCETGICPVHLTCLTAPAFGGQCLHDPDCADVDCTEDSAPFCDLSDNRCRCRSTKETTVSCRDVSDCDGISCPAGQDRACAGGICSCEKKVLIEEDFTCTADAQCPSDCPEGFSPACVDGACACQRTLESVPVSCSTVADCGSVSCPDDFEKACLNEVCVCTKTTVE